MGKSSSSFNKETIRHRFDSFCKKIIKGEVIDYERHMAYRRKYEIYPGKICVNDTPAHCRSCISAKIQAIGRNISTDYGFHKKLC